MANRIFFQGGLCVFGAVLALMYITSCSSSGEDLQLTELRKDFVDPPARARPSAYMDFVDGNFQLEEITREMEEARKMGMGGFDIWDVSSRVDEDSIMPRGPAFMSEASVEAIVHAIKEAERLGLDLGLVIASGWNAGGTWTLPRHQTMGLYHSRVRATGPASITRQLAYPILRDTARRDHRGKPIHIPRGPDGKPLYSKEVAVLAWQEDALGEVPGKVLDLSAHMDSSGLLRWEVPEGTWIISRYVCANTGETMFSATPNSIGPMIDHFSAEAGERHIRFFIDKLEAALGRPLKGSGLKYFYTDSYEVRGQLWTPAMADEFESRYGYSLIPFLPALEGKEVGGEETTLRFMYDYRKLLSDLIVENHYACIREICEEHGVAFSAEAAGPGPPLHNCPFESLRSSGVLSFPRGEFWHIPSNNDHWERSMGHRRHHYLVENQVIKGVASASHIYNQKYVEAEAFTGVHLWNEGPGDLKATADRAFCEGLNRIVYHTWPHTPEEAGTPGWIYSFGTLVNEHRIWWPMSRPWNDYLGRCSYLLQEGNYVGDVLIFYGDSAPNFVPAKDLIPELGFGYEYDYCNSDVLVNKLEVLEGKLVLPHGQSYEVLRLPDEDYMQPEVLEKVLELVDAGARVIGPRPARSHGLTQADLRDEQVRELAGKLWGPADGQTVTRNAFGQGQVIWGEGLRQVLQEMGVGPDFDFRGSARNTDLDFIHRRLGETEVYFIWNRLDQVVLGTGIFRQEDKEVEYWDPSSGKMAKVFGAEQGEGHMSLPLSLDPHGSLFVVFSPSMNDGWEVDAEPEFGGFLSNSLQASRTLDGPWQVHFPEEDAGAGVVEFEELVYWNRRPEDPVRFFSGIATYQKEFEWEGNTEGVYLEMEQVVETARILVNGQDMGVVWHTPFRCDISAALKEGNNHLEIQVANTWHNGLCWDRRLPLEKRRTKSNITRLPNAWTFPMDEIPNEQYGLIDGGISGEVRLLSIK